MDVKEGESSKSVESSVNVAISDEEKAIYDRQIRLWGFEAQNRLRNSSVLIAGLSGCGAEVAKNLMLAGLKSVTLLDHIKVTENDESNQFLIAPGSIGQNRAEASRSRCHVLNPHVALHVDTSDIANKHDDFFKQFDLVVLVDQKYSTVAKIDKICRAAHIGFVAGGVFGWTGYGFFDFNEHIFLLKPRKVVMTMFSDEDGPSEEQPSPAKKARGNVGNVDVAQAGGQNQEIIDIGEDDEERVETKFHFASWEETMNVDWTQKKLIRKSKRLIPSCYFPIRALLRAYDSHDEVDLELILKLWKEELESCNHRFDMQPLEESDSVFFTDPPFGPACAIVGAMVAQEVIKALSQNDEPLRNLFLYSALETAGFVCNFPPIV
ncbi:SUMO-activating enzyme subunit aos-1 [Toxocara canis]|uniref:SUMO-activating enzyme subunit aos-1 n=1 Tax=Toxocara canis TaxID=6265 RepID=A0A0B2VNN3_TOXCA|nr:SUMO-activating enzyme subunit aos-1 [Toxocara canis]